MTHTNIIGKRILAIVAHPDDESFIAAALLKTNADSGGSNMLVCATRGGRGMSHLPRPMSVRRLKAVRTRELRNACKLLSVTAPVIMDIPDGDVEHHVLTFRRRSHTVARAFRPDFIMSFGPDGFSGHHDHIASHRVSYDVARRLRVPLLCATLPETVTKRSLQWLIKRRSHNRYHHELRHDPPELNIPVDASFKLKLLKKHRSQFGRGVPLSDFPKYVAREILKAEHFTVRYPR